MVLIAHAKKRTADFYDEAPLERFLLLWQTMARDATYEAIHERAETEFAINSRTDPVGVSWDPGPGNENTAGSRCWYMFNLCYHLDTQ